MTMDRAHLRLDGVYPQRQKEFFMQRVKLPAGIISAQQALTVAAVAQRHARGLAHLTTRGSIELHWITEWDLPAVAATLASVGLVNRGACGGAVRGVVCGSLSAAGAPALEALARRIHRHFTGNPRFENLPKKFKVGIEADTSSGRHLIQDVGLVPAPSEDGRSLFNVWIAGGLGREPTPGFLLAEGFPEERLLPLIETIARVYRQNTPPPKRLKYFAAQIGRDALRDLILSDTALAEGLTSPPSFTASLIPPAAQGGGRVEARVFAGELPAAGLAALAEIAARHCGGILMVTGDQNIALHPAAEGHRAALLRELEQAGFGEASLRERVTFRVCPGNHECLLGLSPTREVAALLLEEMGPVAQGLTWAISGCPNCCAQPQLAQVGVVSPRLVGEGEARAPRFDLYRPGSGPFTEVVQAGLTLDELREAVRQLG